MPLEWILIQVFVNTVEIGALFYLLCSKFAAKGRTFIPTLSFVVGFVVFMSLPMFISFRGLPLTEIVTLSFSFIYLLFFRNGRILKKIFWVLIGYSLIIAIAFFSITVITFLRGVYHIDIINVTSIERLLTMILAKTLQVIIFYILAKRKKQDERRNITSPMPVFVCFTIPLVNLAIMIFIHIWIVRGLEIPENVSFLVSVGFFVTNIIVFVLYEIINREAEKNYDLIAKNKQYELTEEHNGQVIEIYERMREWRHDYNNHMQLVVGMLEKADSNENSEAIDYIKNLDEKIKSSSLEIVTGNHIVDAIVSAKATLASVHNIAFEHNILLTEEISVDDTDLCSVLSNLIDNAIEACCKLDDGRYISLEMIIFRNQLSIKISNSTDGEYKLENGKFKTTKRGDLHGIGMGHIKSIVENYGGIYDIKPESDSFTTNISIPLARQHTSALRTNL
ncbi:MAG: GHKL domain-containing protein [Treponema sp.]|nr:GHKL domain-containing protein [Treponema sp.]